MANSMAGELILVVDDRPLDLKLFQVLLMQNGYVVKTATDAETAIMVLEVSAPKLLIVNIRLPGIDGLTLVRKLRNHQRTASMIILGVSAYDLEGGTRKAIDAGCDGFITKPIDVEKLPIMIALYLSGSRKGK